MRKIDQHVSLSVRQLRTSAKEASITDAYMIFYSLMILFYFRQIALRLDSKNSTMNDE